MNNAKHFIEKTGKNWFSFADRADNVELDHAPQWAADFPQLVFVGGGEMSGDFRFAKVLKTVAHVVIDEDAEGNPITERWQIRQD